MTSRSWCPSLWSPKLTTTNRTAHNPHVVISVARAYAKTETTAVVKGRHALLGCGVGARRVAWTQSNEYVLAKPVTLCSIGVPPQNGKKITKFAEDARERFSLFFKPATRFVGGFQMHDKPRSKPSHCAEYERKVYCELVDARELDGCAVKRQPQARCGETCFLRRTALFYTGKICRTGHLNSLYRPVSNFNPKIHVCYSAFSRLWSVSRASIFSPAIPWNYSD